jgi:hypothetical protein
MWFGNEQSMGRCVFFLGKIETREELLWLGLGALLIWNLCAGLGANTLDGAGAFYKILDSSSVKMES